MNPVMFNAEFYLAQNEDVRVAVANGVFPDALTHFQQFGQFELRDPNAFFDTSFYLSNNGDVLQALANGTVDSAFQHFTQFGQFEDVVRAPNETFASFDAEAYLANNPDVAAAIPGFFPNAFAHFLQFGVNENREGAPNFQPGQDALSQALVALQDATEARAEFDLDEGTTADLTTELEVAESTLASARAIDSDRALAADLADAQEALEDANAEIDSVAGLRAAVTRLDAAPVAVEAATAAVAVADANQAGADARLETLLGGTITIDDATGIASISRPAAAPTDPDVVTNLLVLNSADVLVVNPLLIGADAAAAAELLPVVQARLDADEALADANQEVIDAQTAFDAIPDRASPAATNDELFADRNTAATAIVDAQEALDERGGLIEAVAEAEATLAQSVALDDALEAANLALEDLNVENVVLVDGPETATADADLFVAGTIDSTITGFEAGEDVLFIGGGFTRVDLADDAEFADGVGSASTLEVFIQQTDAGAVVTLEQEAFGGNAPGFGAGLTQITLAGVDADDITIDANGFLRVTEADAAMV